jgi:hypothetical protein
MHTVRWGGAWSYNRLNLTEQDRELDERLKEGPCGQCYSICENTDLVPVTDVVERAIAERTLKDAQKMAALRARQEVAKEVLPELDEDD